MYFACYDAYQNILVVAQSFNSLTLDNNKINLLVLGKELT